MGSAHLLYLLLQKCLIDTPQDYLLKKNYIFLTLPPDFVTIGVTVPEEMGVTDRQTEGRTVNRL